LGSINFQPLRLLFFLAIHFSLAALPFQDRQLDPAALTDLYSALGIEEEQAIAQTQQQWLRKKNQERWHLEELPEEKRLFVINWAQKQGLYDRWLPSQSRYDEAHILGATTGRMSKRLTYLTVLWMQGIRFEKIVWLTGERKLDPQVDSLTEICRTETDAARILWQQASLPQAMRELPVEFVSVRMKNEARPNTKDTLIAWLQQKEAPCSCLFISDQPFCGYQFSVIKKTLPADFLFDVAGEGVDPWQKAPAAAVTLDSIARWLFQESLEPDCVPNPNLDRSSKAS
jgi:hypothetical protein